jgi:hypothetical protein
MKWYRFTGCISVGFAITVGLIMSHNGSDISLVKLGAVFLLCIPLFALFSWKNRDENGDISLHKVLSLRNRSR